MLDLGRFGDDVAKGYHRHIIDAHHQPQFFLLVAFLVSFAAIRIVTHAIRAGRWKRVLRNMSTSGGTHLHHLVPGILLLLLSGYLGIALPESFARDPLAVLFGIGAALTLDEFALWLHLEDVYWAREGRESVDAVIIAATIVGIGVLGVQFWLDLGRAVMRMVGIIE
ncbi:MAG: hypothetical protein ACR2OU_10885 [Thermomicrobiales bacterium]